MQSQKWKLKGSEMEERKKKEMNKRKLRKINETQEMKLRKLNERQEIRDETKPDMQRNMKRKILYSLKKPRRFFTALFEWKLLN